MKMKKILALAIAAVMMMALCVSAWAEGETPAEGTFTGIVETTIKATDVDEGDSVYYFQLVEWDTTNTGWKLSTLGNKVKDKYSDDFGSVDAFKDITQAKAVKIAEALRNETIGDDNKMVANGTTHTYDNASAGLYYLKAVSVGNTIYNPAFVSADYYQGGNTVSFSSNYETGTIVKKSGVTFEKTADKITAAVGEEIEFTISTTIPAYGSAYSDPKFVITDTLSDGLELVDDSWTAKYGSENETDFTSTEVTFAKGSGDNAKKQLTINFSGSYLAGLTAPVNDVTITYKAKVTDSAQYNVNAMSNTAELEYSNDPTTSTSTGKLNDKTRHYTFTLDGQLLGSSGETTEVTKELIKVGVDEDNQPILSESERVAVYGSDSAVSPLAGATFKLAKDGMSGKTYTTTNNGRIVFAGLAEGVYTLTEESAPDGYVRDNTEYKVEIKATYDTADTDLLKSYTVAITKSSGSGESESVGSTTFNVTNNSETDTFTSAAVDTSNSKTAQVINGRGMQLPSTGGIGTTIFYIVGGVLIVGAGVMFVTKRRMSGV